MKLCAIGAKRRTRRGCQSVERSLGFQLFQISKISTAGNNEVGEKHGGEEMSQITVVKSP